jgi:hypothetical protein
MNIFAGLAGASIPKIKISTVDARHRTNGCRLWRPAIEQGEAERVWHHERDADVYLQVVARAAETGKARNGAGSIQPSMTA